MLYSTWTVSKMCTVSRGNIILEITAFILPRQLCIHYMQRLVGHYDNAIKLNDL